MSFSRHNLIRIFPLFKYGPSRSITTRNASNSTIEIQTESQKNSSSGSLKASLTEKSKNLRLDLNFDNAEEAFRSKTTLQVVRAYLVFTLCSSTYLVENNMKLMTLAEKVLGKKLFRTLMDATFYGHFVAGENEQSITPIIQRMRSFGVNAILNYSAEEDESRDNNKPSSVVAKSSAEYQNVGQNCIHNSNEKHLDRNVDIFLRCIEAVSTTTQSTGFAAIKLTALGKPELLMQLSEIISQSGRLLSLGKSNSPKNVVIHNKGIIDSDTELMRLLCWSDQIDPKSIFNEHFLVKNFQSKRIESLDKILTMEQREMFERMMRRLDTIFAAALDLNVRVMVDAEQTYFQPAISRLAMELMSKFNKKKAIVFNTYQNYLKETHSNLLRDLDQAERENFYFGAKLVRGAYMEQERARAATMGYDDPVNPTYEDTTTMYHKSLLECLRRIKDLKEKTDERRLLAMVASNDEKTILFALQKMKEFGISSDDKVICFGQNFGMCDQISFPLGQNGYSVYKYTPFGPVEEVMPYLSRRVHENRGVLTKIKKEKRMLLDELKRRLLPGKRSTNSNFLSHH